MSLKIKLTESNQAISKKINQAFADELNKSLSAKVPKLKLQLTPVIRQALNGSPEMASVRAGILKLEFGLENDPSAEIVEAIVDSLDVRFNKVDAKSFSGGFVLVMQPTNFANLLSLPSAEQPIDGGSLPWLQWLLTAGDSIIIADFGVKFGGGFKNSRTGGAIMSKKVAPYKVNSAFSGTSDDNFITRSVDRVSSEINRIIKGVL